MGKSPNLGHAANPKIRLILPGQLGDTEYALVGRTDSQDFVEIKRMLAWASPRAKCIAFSEHIINGITNILIEPEEALSLIGGKAAIPSGTDCLYLPIPENYPWAYWDVWNWFADTPELLDAPTSFAAFKHMFERCKYLRGAVDTRQLQSWNDAEHLFCYWGHGRARFSEHKSELDILLSKLADDESRTTLKMSLASSPQALWQHFVATVFCRADYCPDKWIHQGDSILNLGVFSGHEIPYFYTSASPEGKLYNIDPLGHDLLGARAQRFCKASGDNIIEVRMAAGDRHTKGRFGHYSDGQAYLLPGTEENGCVDFDIAPLDFYVEQQNLQAVDFIKIDIEGMDQEALLGLGKTIEKFRPTISVSIYHCEEHMWSIPSSLINSLKDYVFFVDHFSPFRWETVFTAVPLERR